MSESSDVRAALAAGLKTACESLTPPAAATPVDPTENAKVKNGCAWIVRDRRNYEVRHLGGPRVALRWFITYTFDFQAYKESPKAPDAALKAQTRVDEMVDAFVTWLTDNVTLGDLCLSALPTESDPDGDGLEPRANGWTAAKQLRVRVELHPTP